MRPTTLPTKPNRQTERRSYHNHARLFLFFVAGEQSEFLAKDLLLVQHLLVVDVLEQVRVVNAVSSEELGVSHLERLADRLRYQLRLYITHISTLPSYVSK